MTDDFKWSHALKSAPRAVHLDNWKLPEGIMGGRSLAEEAAALTARRMRAKLDAAALEVLRAGDSWGEGPYEFPLNSQYPDGGLVMPRALTVTCRGGAVPHDWVPPEGWRMIRHSDWVAAGSGGDNLRPFWELPPKRAGDPLREVLREGAVYQRVPGRYIEHGVVEPEHVCGPFVTLWTGYRFCKICEKPTE